MKTKQREENKKMSKYTLELNEVIDYLTENGEKLFDFDYDLPAEVDTAKLEQAFIDYYNFREIGFETIARFKARLKVYWKMVCNKYSSIFTNYYKNFLNSNPMNNYTYEIDDKNTFQATPMSSLDPSKVYATTINTIEGKRTGSQNLDALYKVFNGLYSVDNSPFNNFIREFDNLFMGVL